LAIFHGIATAFHLEQQRELEEIFPLLGHDEGCVWFKDDMKHVLAEMYETCLSFLQVKNTLGICTMNQSAI
jgi:hypothetical protein